MLESLTMWSLLASMMQIFGDLFVVIAVGLAAVIFVGELVFKIPGNQLVNAWVGAIMMTVVSTIGLISKVAIGLDSPNGFLIGFGDGIVALLLLLSVLLLVGTIVIPRLRG